MHKEYQIIIISYLIPMSVPAILPPSFLHLPLCYFLHLCPLPLSPPFQGGLWLPCTKNSFCHLRSAHAILHRCHNKAHTHSAECYTLRLLKGRDSIDSMKYFVSTSVHELHKYRNNPDALEAAQEPRSRQMTTINWRLNDSLIMNTSSLQCLESTQGGESDTE